MSIQNTTVSADFFYIKLCAFFNRFKIMRQGNLYKPPSMAVIIMYELDATFLQLLLYRYS